MGHGIEFEQNHGVAVRLVLVVRVYLMVPA